MNVSHEYYKETYGGSLIPENRWKSLEIKMTARLNQYTFNRMKEGECPEEAKAALCEMCEYAYRDEKRGGKTSETNDGCSATYDTGRSLDATLYGIAETYLANTGLMYRGVMNHDDECDDYDL